MFLPEMSIRRPVTTFVIMAAIILFGVISLVRLGIDQFPKVEMPTVTVTTLLEGASPDIVEENVTDIIEEEVATLEGVKKVTSISSHGASIVTIEFELDRDIDLAAQDVRDRVAGAARRLPDDVEPPTISKLDMQAQPIMWVAVSGDRKIQDLTYFADKVLKPRLETISGVGSVMAGGRRDRAVRLWIDRTRLEALGVTADDVVNAVKRENVELPGGFLRSDKIEFSVKVDSEFKDVRSFSELIVAYSKGAPIRMKDIGRVEDGLIDKTSIARYKGVSAVGLGIRKKAGANTVEVADMVKAELERAKAILPAGMTLDVAFDSSVFVKDSMHEMYFALIFGGILAAFVVLVFLKSPSATIITGITIPLSIIGTFMFTYFFGFTLNSMTMLALTLAVGVVIDDAIIIIESIQRHRERGKGKVDGARDGASEIAFAAMATSFALAAVFIPVAFMSGVVGRFFYEFGLTVAISIFISLFVALTSTPMLSSKFLSMKESEFVLFRKFDELYAKVETLYAEYLAKALERRGLVIAAAIGIFLFSLVVWMMLGKEFMPKEDQSRFMIAYQAPVGSSIEYTDSKLRFIEKVLSDTPEIRSYFAVVGFGNSGAHKGICFVRMIPKGNRKRSQAEVISELRRKLNVEPGLKAFINEFSVGFGAQRGPQIEYVIKGPTLEELDKYSGIIAEKFSRIPGVVGVDTDYDVGLPELKLIVDRDRAADAGVDATSLTRMINALVGGSNVSTYKEGGTRYDVRVKLDENLKVEPQDILALTVRNKHGAPVRISNFVTVDQGVGANVINRRDRERSIAVTANLEKGKTLGSAIADLDKIAKEVLPSEGFTTGLSGGAEQFKETFFSMIFAFFLASVITYMVLASLFESFAHPFTVMLALPLSIIGALGALFVTGNTVNIYSMIGITLLIGLVTKNSIILVDYTNRLRSEGMEMYAALRKAGPIRLRPILMTAFSTIFGVLPTAVGFGAGSESRSPMAIATIGGVMTSTFLTLFVIPAAYTIVDEFVRRIKKAGPDVAKSATAQADTDDLPEAVDFIEEPSDTHAKDYDTRGRRDY
ncbi:MAG: efflux RND transporter permease subunit [Deltaproteobacteria bacterium]|nr:efflux RND transporter permease subunit [Deltaproteobacteria bacterium]